MCAVVLSNSAENALLRHLFNTGEQDLQRIPAEHHLGQTLYLDIRLALMMIVEVV